MTSPRTPTHVAVVGGGIAGLSAAHVLVGAGVRVTVYDKGRGPGGRASTRRRDVHQFDHGAQYFTARDARFRAVVESWCRRGVAAEWSARFAAVDEPGVFRSMRSGEARWVGVPGMSALAGDLAAGLGRHAEVRFGARVARVEPAAGGWVVWRDGDAAGEAFDALLVCTPAPQALALLDGHTTLAEAVGRARMTPCWSAMCAFDASLDVDADALFVNVPGQPLAWASRDSSKPARAAGERWVLHATAEWSSEHVDDAPEAVPRALLDALAVAIGRALPTPTFADAHRWLYAHGALDPAPGALVDASRALAVAGDWCHGARIEGAWLSGMVAAERLLAGAGALAEVRA